MKDRENVGIEVLRVLAMLMIVGLHYLGFGGVIHDPETKNNEIGWFLESFNYVAVDVYVLISGFLLVNSTKFKPKRVFDLWFQVFFYSVGIFMVFYYFKGVQWSFEPFLPIKFKMYWFATAYLGLYLLHPYLNRIMRGLEKREFKRLIIIMVLMFGVLSFVGNDSYQVQGGYSLIWFVVLYVIGGYIRISNVKVDSWIMWGLYVILSLFTFYTKAKFGDDPDIFYSYNSVSVLGASVALFMCFKDLQINNMLVRRFFTYFGSLTFGVYLIHENPFIRDWLWKGAEGYYNSPDFLKNYFMTILMVFFICASIEKIRQIIFGVIGKILIKGVEIVENVVDKIVLIIREIDKDGNIISEKQKETFVVITDDGILSGTEGKKDLPYFGEDSGIIGGDRCIGGKPY